MNQIIIIGRITRDFELVKTNNGTNVVNFTLAVNRNYRNDDGEYEADFIDCVAFGDRAKLIYDYVRKGHRLGVVGRLQRRQWQNNEGENRYSWEVIVSEIEFLEPKGEKEDLPYPEAVGRENPKPKSKWEKQAEEAQTSPYDYMEEKSPEDIVDDYFDKENIDLGSLGKKADDDLPF